jgi:hypothetical protein
VRETFLVKHAVGGRTFIDTDKSPLDYQVIEQGGGWKFTVKVPMDAVVSEILKWKQELNVFLFQEFDDRPTLKNWFYVKEGPVDYDSRHQQLTIVADSKISYIPDQFGSSAVGNS